MGRGGKLEPLQERFCYEYLKDCNATQAAIRAGYSENTAYSQGQRLLKNVEVSELIQKLKEDRAEKTKIDAEYVLRQAVKLHERTMQEIEPVMRGGEQVTDEKGRLVFAFDAKAACSSLKLIGDHVGVQAFKQNMGIDDMRERIISDVLPKKKREQVDREFDESF